MHVTTLHQVDNNYMYYIVSVNKVPDVDVSFNVCRTQGLCSVVLRRYSQYCLHRTHAPSHCNARYCVIDSV